MLPLLKNCPLVFIQKIVNGKKLVIFKKNRKSYTVPYWEELSVDKQWDAACTVKDFLRHMPDEWDTAKKVERAFFWDVLSTLAYDYVDALVTECDYLREQAKLQKKVVP